ncbi:chlorinating enzyme [Streptomyces sp. enrichment culture]|uniref:chlorinating enzyme n=1 Tax=Streptomyces sp. enrichment culture TaxID=1795815 RepID=UPI003F55F747
MAQRRTEQHHAQQRHATYALGPAELEQFHRDGYIGPFDLYDAADMERELRALRPKLLNTKRAVYGGDRTVAGATDLANYDRHLDVEFLARHITRPQIVDRVASILGPDVLCWRSEFFPKYPGDEGTDWHQADNFSNVAGSKHPQIVWPQDASFGGTITVWTAFTPATEDNGCLQFIPGTHRTMNYDESKVMEYDAGSINKVDKDGVRRGFFGYDYRQLQKDPDWRPDESKAVAQVMRQGQFIIFWSTLMHASLPHSGLTDQMRLGYAARYLPTSVRVYPYSDSLDEFGGSASLAKFGNVLVAGEDRFGHNRFTDRTVDGFPFPVRTGAGRPR